MPKHVSQCYNLAELSGQDASSGIAYFGVAHCSSICIAAVRIGAADYNTITAVYCIAISFSMHRCAYA